MPKKKYTQAEWSRLQSRLPQEDRVAYADSPEIPTTEELAATLKQDAQTATQKSDTLLKEIAADKQAALDAKKEAENALIAATGAKTLAGAKIAAAKRDVSRNPGVIEANKALAAATAQANKTTQQQYTGGGSVVDTGAAERLKAEQAAKLAAEEKRRQGQSAFDLLKSQFALYGLEGLVSDVEKYVKDGLSQAEFTLRLRTESDAYKQRFGANQARIQKGLRALSEAEYINLEDQYQDVMRRYGLPESYYKRGDLGRQEGFEKFIGGDVSPVELEDRIQTAQRRVMNAAPQIKDALTQYYGDEISNGDILAYVLDPNKAIENIKRKVTAAEIGGAAKLAGLGATRTRAEELGALGVTSQQAREGFQAISEFLPTATKLGDIYAKQGMGPFTQTTAEAEVFGTTGAAEAAQKRKKLTQLETAQFSGQVGAAGGALGRERAGQF